MLVAVVVHLQAEEGGVLQDATGPAVHGLWFNRWGSVAPDVADRLHTVRSVAPYTLSPLMGLPHPRRGQVFVTQGDRAWFRVTTLTADLSARVEQDWLPRLPPVVPIAGLRWRVAGWTADATEHAWAGRADPQVLAEKHLLSKPSPSLWKLTFETPTAFHGEAGHLPFPLPNVLLGSWMDRWEALGPVRLPNDLVEKARGGLAVSAFRLKTVPVRDRRRLVIGCVGEMALRATKLSPGERAAVDLLATYAFWASSGHYTTQGMGMTQAQRRREKRDSGTAD